MHPCVYLLGKSWYPHTLYMSDAEGVGGRGPKLQEGSVRQREGHRESERAWRSLFTASEFLGPALKNPWPQRARLPEDNQGLHLPCREGGKAGWDQVQTDFPEAVPERRLNGRSWGKKLKP